MALLRLLLFMAVRFAVTIVLTRSRGMTKPFSASTRRNSSMPEPIATNGGVTFGGGEPFLRLQFIREFRELCGPSWQLNLETSLNVPPVYVEALLPSVNTLIIDIKDMNPDIYRGYTGQSNSLVLDNLCLIKETGRQNDCIIRIPLIPSHNSEADREISRKAIERLGFTRFDLFTYQIRKH